MALILELGENMQMVAASETARHAAPGDPTSGYGVCALSRWLRSVKDSHVHLPCACVLAAHVNVQALSGRVMRGCVAAQAFWGGRGIPQARNTEDQDWA